MKFQPHLISKILTKTFHDRDLPRLPSPLRESIAYLTEIGLLKIYVVNQDRGRFYSTEPMIITLPIWVMSENDRETGKFTWYVAHEMSHALNWLNRHHPHREFDHHGPNFMACLKMLCPSWCIEHELGYKPRNAAAAGIGQHGNPAYRNIIIDSDCV
jgi:hypothetical protein